VRGAGCGVRGEGRGAKKLACGFALCAAITREERKRAARAAFAAPHVFSSSSLKPVASSLLELLLGAGEFAAAHVVAEVADSLGDRGAQVGVGFDEPRNVAAG
jgi:hypothetical protein